MNLRPSVVQGCVLFLGAAITTLLSHEAIDVLTAESGHGDAYAGYRHIALGPLLLVAAMAAATLIVWFCVTALASKGASDPIVVFSRLTVRIPAWRFALVTFAAGTLLLFGIEFCEQLTAFGHINGISDALGGNAVLGLSVLACIACALTYAARAGTGYILRALTVCCRAVARFIERFSVDATARLRGLKSSLPVILRSIEPPLARRLGLRAPPLFLRT